MGGVNTDICSDTAEGKSVAGMVGKEEAVLLKRKWMRMKLGERQEQEVGLRIHRVMAMLEIKKGLVMSMVNSLKAEGEQEERWTGTMRAVVEMDMEERPNLMTVMKQQIGKDFSSP